MLTINLRNFALACLVCFASCSSSEDGEGDVNFNSSDMLANYSDNLIQPAFADYKSKTELLNTAVGTFTTTPNQTNLEGVRSAFVDTYKAWTMVDPFQFGPAVETVSLLNKSNNFPTQYTEIETQIETGSWDFSGLYAGDKMGLPALDYLLYNGTDAEVIEAFSTGEDVANRKQLAQELADNLKSNATQVYNQWNSTYASEFVKKEGNDPSSALSLIVNEMNKSYERTKNQRLGYPLGTRSLEGDTFPKTVEAYYSKQSLTLLKLHFQAIKNLFKGQDNDNNGAGLDDYLDAHYKAGNISEDLTAKILAQMDIIETKLDEVPETLDAEVAVKSQKTQDAYSAMQSLVVLIKSEMTSALSVSITYQDNDGD